MSAAGWRMPWPDTAIQISFSNQVCCCMIRSDENFFLLNICVLPELKTKDFGGKLIFITDFNMIIPQVILTLIKRTKYFNFLEIRQLITDFLRLLHEPRLPLNNMNDVMSSVGARLPSDLQRIIAKALKNYEQELYRYYNLINLQTP